MLVFASEEPNLQACEENSEEENDDVVGFLSTDALSDLSTEWH
jgi:hypothetical protein